MNTGTLATHLVAYYIVPTLIAALLYSRFELRSRRETRRTGLKAVS